MTAGRNVAAFQCASCGEFRNAANTPNFNERGERICHPCELLAADDVEPSIKEGLRAIRRRRAETSTTGLPCANCDGPVIAAHGPYFNGDGDRICAVCDVKGDPVLGPAMAEGLRRIRARREGDRGLIAASWVEESIKEELRRVRRQRDEARHVDWTRESCGHTPTGFRPGVLDCTRQPHAADVPHRYEKN